MKFDVAVIGAGVVGCAITRRFALNGKKVVLLEKGQDLLSGASKANSAILHTGFDATPGSLEVACMQAGYREYLDIHQAMNLPALETGAIVAAWTPQEEQALDGILAKAHENGVTDVRRITRAEVLAREPHLGRDVRAGVLVPREYLIDPWSSPLAYLTQARAHGAELVFGAEVQSGQFDGQHWQLATPKGNFTAAHVINCAGNHGDLVEIGLLGASDFQIRPRKGQFVVFDKPASALFGSIILPVPTERTKGVVLTRTIFGNALIGPTAEEQTNRSRATVDHDTLETLRAQAIRILPALADVPVTAVYAGLRPASEEKDFRINAKPGQNWLTVGGIRSTGLTAALGIASHVWDLYQDNWTVPFVPVTDPVIPQMPNLAEHLPRDWHQANRSPIICHCEMVTEREIRAAMDSPIPPGDFGGLRRRTRCAMGRCQGFNCLARIAALTGDKLVPPLSLGVQE